MCESREIKLGRRERSNFGETEEEEDEHYGV